MRLLHAYKVSASETKKSSNNSHRAQMKIVPDRSVITLARQVFHYMSVISYQVWPRSPLLMNHCLSKMSGRRVDTYFLYWLFLLSFACSAWNPSNALCKFSMMSSANTSGSGRLSRSARLLSFTQKMSRLFLSRFQISSALNFLHLPSGFSSDQVSFL